jgi:hypothetical protein
VIRPLLGVIDSRSVSGLCCTTAVAARRYMRSPREHLPDGLEWWRSKDERLHTSLLPLRIRPDGLGTPAMRSGTAKNPALTMAVGAEFDEVGADCPRLQVR